MSLSATTITVTVQFGVFTQAKFHVLVRTKGHLSLGHLLLVNSLLLNIEEISQELWSMPKALLSNNFHLVHFYAYSRS